MDVGLDALLSERDIRNALLRYCRGIDRADEQLIRSAYHSDARDERGWFSGTGWEFARLIAEDFRSKPRASTHFLTNTLIELSGDTARVESYTLALSSDPEPSGPVHTFAGRYLDVFERRDRQWLIAQRTVVRDWNAAIERVEGTGFIRDLGDQLRGSSSCEDPSYALFAEDSTVRTGDGQT